MELSELFDQPNSSGWLFLTEEPQSTGDFGWNLSDPKIRNEQRQKLLSDHPTRIGTYNGLAVFRRRSQIFALDEANDNDLVYWVKAEVRRVSVIGGSAICQRALWRNTSVTAALGLPKYIFFDIWLKEFDAVVTDGMQTAGGKNFWFHRVENAFDRGLNVYYVKEVVPRKVQKLTMSEFTKLGLDGTIWGKDKSYRNRLIVITTKNLKEVDGNDQNNHQEKRQGRAI